MRVIRAIFWNIIYLFKRKPDNLSAVAKMWGRRMGYRIREVKLTPTKPADLRGIPKIEEAKWKVY